ncbi:hypothetical protein DRN74_00870 [Candidatus Micrarchaeota archaeon]|nr:MAG: hypothetical protein DRN74_00870 [Candidatus Micrarchaeota archaeon]
MMKTKNRKQIIVLVGGILVGIVTGTIITAHHFGQMGGRAFPEFIFCGTSGILIASIIKYLVDKRKGINTTTSKLILAVSLCIIVGLLIGAGIGYHYFFKLEATPSNGQSTKIEPTKEMVEKIVFYEKGKQEIIDLKSEDGKEIASLLTRKLHELNLQATCVFSEEDIQEIKQKDRVAELIFKKPVDITISQWTEPEERYHIPVDEKGYRILENVKIAIFILEDNQERGLEAHILVGHRVEGRTGYSCWAINIKEEGKPELDKSWIDRINRLINKAGASNIF